jgi:hypothetical protein
VVVAAAALELVHVRVRGVAHLPAHRLAAVPLARLHAKHLDEVVRAGRAHVRVHEVLHGKCAQRVKCSTLNVLNVERNTPA